MLTQISGIHHITSIASDAAANNRFFTGLLGLRRVKKTVNFDAPDVYHLYYGNEVGTPGTVMTYFPFPGAQRGRKGSGEVASTVFSVPPDTFDFWRARLAEGGAANVESRAWMGEQRLFFEGPDGEGFALCQVAGDERAPWTGGGIDSGNAIRGFHSATLRLRDVTATQELLQFMGYEVAGEEGTVRRMRLARGNEARFIDLDQAADAPAAQQGAGSVHHIAFAVADRIKQEEVRDALVAAGHQITPVIDRDYFYSIYFRTPGGVLFEIATAEPGFERDEDRTHLGESLKLPSQHEHLRDRLQEHLPPIGTA